LDIRLDENNIPKQGEEPINQIDRLAYIHDLEYQKSNNITDRHQADINMINELKTLKNLTIPQKLIRVLITKNFQAKIKLGQNIHADEIHKQFRKPKQLRTISFKSKDNIWNADLIIMPLENKFKYILTIMDGFTRFLWTVPLKHKTGLEVSNAFKQIIKKSGRKPNKLFVDQGKEFYNQHMYKLFKFKKSDILEKDSKGEYINEIYSVFNSGKNPIIERVNKTLTNKLWKQFTINKN
jgi:hypothetical protein